MSLIYTDAIKDSAGKDDFLEDEELVIHTLEDETRENKMSLIYTKEPTLFRKKPVDILAMKWTGNNFDAIKDFAGKNVFLEEGELVIRTLEDGKTGKAKHVASIGDFIIQGVQGEFYFCKPDIFDQTYSIVLG